EDAAGEALPGAADHHHRQAGRQPAQHREGQEADAIRDQVAAGRKHIGEPRGQRDRDDLGGEIGGRNPAPLVERRGEPTLNLLERGIGDLDVQHRHEGAEDGAEHGDPVPGGGLALARGHQRAGAANVYRSPLGGSVRRSTVAVTDRPGRSWSSRSAGTSWIVILTGTRCTILVKFPVAFSGGRSANCAPLPGARLSTVPLKCTPGKVSIPRSADSPRNMRSISVSLKLATT